MLTHIVAVIKEQREKQDREKEDKAREERLVHNPDAREKEAHTKWAA